jgi:epoxyqueuosine reductase
LGAGKLKDLIRKIAVELGFSDVGVSRAEPLDGGRYLAWLAEGRHGEMSYMERNADLRLQPELLLPGVKSIVSLSIDYHPGVEPPVGDPTQGAISKYAMGRDYHKVFRQRLAHFTEHLRGLLPEMGWRSFSDAGPVLEKVWAQKAGLGWIGKHTNLISRKRGSWFFLGEVLVDQDIEPDLPGPDFCGSCRRCIVACPTQAIVAPYVLDARRCISYLTIELRSAIPEELRPDMGNLVFGCDICQDVCPWNRKSRVGGDPEFSERSAEYSLANFARFDAEKFAGRFSGTPVMRTKWRGFLRNVVVAMGNSKSREFLPHLTALSNSGDELIEEHAGWALRRIE